MDKRNHITGTNTADFFFEHAGYSYTPTRETEIQGRANNALQLAYAAAVARTNGYTFEWDVDTEDDSSTFSEWRPRWQLWVCTMRDADGTIYDTVGGVDFGPNGHPSSSTYRHVAEAEMALQNLSRIEDES